MNIKKCITVDFDETLAKTDTCWNGWMHMGTGAIVPIPEVIDFVRQKHSQGYDVHIVTFRPDEHRQEVVDFVKEHKLPIKDIHCTAGKNKTPTLLKLKSELHVDDFVETLVLAEMEGIKCLLVDAGQHEKNSTAKLFERIEIN
jgi:hypothetical protein